jgi:hypothetical protein
VNLFLFLGFFGGGSVQQVESSVRLLLVSATMGPAVDVVKRTCRSSGDDEMWHGMNQSLAIAASDHDEGSLQAARGFMTAFDMPKLNTFGQAFRFVAQ